MVDVRFLEAHSEIFHAGKNFGKKIQPKMIQGCTLKYDKEEKEFLLTWQNRTFHLPKTSVHGYELEDGQVIKLPVNEHQAHDITKMVSAQVSTPHGHVFEGQGSGQAGRGKKIKQ